MKIPNILIIAFVLTFVSGLYIFQVGFFYKTIWIPSYDSPIHFGFPLPWLETYMEQLSLRGGLEAPGPWVLTFLGLGFLIDFLIYGAIVIIAMRIYEKMLEHISKPELYRRFLWLSAVLLVVVCWAVIFWYPHKQTPFFGFLWYFLGHSMGSRTYTAYRGESFLRFLLGLMTIIFSWFLIKYLKQVSTPPATSSD